MKLLISVLASVLGFALSAEAAATPLDGCELESELRAGSGVQGRLLSTSAGVLGGVVFLARRPLDGSIVALVPDADEYREIGLYWPTPADPVYAYRRMQRLPRDTTFLGNAADQTIIVLRSPTEFVVAGVATNYRPLDYAGHVLSIDGCGGNDDLHGGDGSDHLFDYVGDNELRGYDGRDWLEGTGTFFAGGAGDDCITGDGKAAFAQIFGDEGNDRLESVGAAGTAQGGEGADSCVASTVAACESATSALCLGWL
jgi:Ca2+-binding RTX toxin-like protein